MSLLAIINDQLVAQQCCNCGIRFAMPESRRAQLQENRRSFWCPNGHEQHFTGDREVDKVRAELAREKQRREMAEREAAQEARRAVEAEKERDRLAKRARNGVCPCCTRSFQNLRRHMATKHPEHKRRSSQAVSS